MSAGAGPLFANVAPAISPFAAMLVVLVVSFGGMNGFLNGATGVTACSGGSSASPIASASTARTGCLEPCSLWPSPTTTASSTSRPAAARRMCLCPLFIVSPFGDDYLVEVAGAEERADGVELQA